MNDPQVLIDLGRLEADLAAAEERVSQAEAAVAAATDALHSARSDQQRLLDLRNYLARYAVESVGSDEGAAISLRSGPYNGLSGFDAARQFVQRHPSETWVLRNAIAEMTELGFSGTRNALSVAFTQLARDGVIERGAVRGHYVFPGPAGEPPQLEVDG